jgi:hypothetical protein
MKRSARTSKNNLNSAVKNFSSSAETTASDNQQHPEARSSKRHKPIEPALSHTSKTAATSSRKGEKSPPISETLTSKAIPLADALPDLSLGENLTRRRSTRIKRTILNTPVKKPQVRNTPAAGEAKESKEGKTPIEDDLPLLVTPTKVRTRLDGPSDGKFIDIEPKEPRRSGLHYKYIPKGSPLREGEKSSCWVLPDVLDDRPNELEQNWKDIPGHRPGVVFSRPSPGGRPTIAITPERGTVLSRRTDLGYVIIFDNSCKIEKPAPQELKEPSNKDDILNKLKEAPKSFKEQTYELTDQILKTCKKKRCEDDNRRSPSQQQAIASTGTVSAQEIVRVTSSKIYRKEMKYVLCHLIAWSFKGKASQKADNLVAGTTFANENMTFVESEIPHLAKILEGEKIRLEVVANVNPGTHVATTIEYNVITDNFILPFIFDMQTTIRPKTSTAGYLRGLTDLLLNTNDEVVKKLDFSGTAAPLSSSSGSPAESASSLSLVTMPEILLSAESSSSSLVSSRIGTDKLSFVDRLTASRVSTTKLAPTL